MNIGVRLEDQGAGIVSVLHEPIPGPVKNGVQGAVHCLVTGIERLPFDVTAVAARIRQMTAPGVQFIIDGDGLGTALWTLLGGPDNDQLQLYTARGQERQALVDELVVAIEDNRFHFAPRLAEQEAMTKGLVSYRRTVKDDGVIGSELVVALLLAIRPVPPQPSYFSPMPTVEPDRSPWAVFGDDDE